MDAPALTRFLDASTTHALRYRRWRLALEAEGTRTGLAPSAGRTLLAAMLLEKERFAIERAFRALGLLHAREEVRRIYLGFGDVDPKLRASSRELLEALVRPPLRGALLMLVDPSEDAATAEQAAFYDAPRSFIGTGLLEELLTGSSAALRALAAYHAAERGLQHLRPRLRALRETASPELRAVLERAEGMLDAQAAAREPQPARRADVH